MREEDIDQKLEELTDLVQHNNKMLRSERNSRRVKTLFRFLMVLVAVGFAVYLFRTYSVQFFDLYAQVEGLWTQVQELQSSAKQVQDSLTSVSGVLKGGE